MPRCRTRTQQVREEQAIVYERKIRTDPTTVPYTTAHSTATRRPRRSRGEAEASYRLWTDERHPTPRALRRSAARLDRILSAALGARRSPHRPNRVTNPSSQREERCSHREEGAHADRDHPEWIRRGAAPNVR